jgi:hypothetical protein
MLRRIAWALDLPMTRGIEAVFDYLVRVIERDKICASCRDPTRCSSCGILPRITDSISYFEKPFLVGKEGLFA